MPRWRATWRRRDEGLAAAGRRPARRSERLQDAAAFLLDTARTSASRASQHRDAYRQPTATATLQALAIVNDDMPFLVDSVAATIAAHEACDRPAGPSGAARRARCAGHAQRLPARAATQRRIDDLYRDFADRRPPAPRAAPTRSTPTLADVRAAVTDWPQDAGADHARTPIGVADPEAAELLRWLGGGKLTQLGHVTRQRDGSNVAAARHLPQIGQGGAVRRNLRARLRMVRQGRRRRARR